MAMTDASIFLRVNGSFRKIAPGRDVDRLDWLRIAAIPTLVYFIPAIQKMSARYDPRWRLAARTASLARRKTWKIRGGAARAARSGASRRGSRSGGRSSPQHGGMVETAWRSRSRAPGDHREDAPHYARTSCRGGAVGSLMLGGDEDSGDKTPSRGAAAREMFASSTVASSTVRGA